MRHSRQISISKIWLYCGDQNVTPRKVNIGFIFSSGVIMTALNKSPSKTSKVLADFHHTNDFLVSL